MTWSNLSKGSRCSALCWKLGGKHPDMQLIACCQWILLKLPMFFSSNGFKLFSERRFTYQGITKFCTGSYVINSIHRYHWVSSFSIALITCIQQLNFFLHSPSLLWRYKWRGGGEREGEKDFAFFILCFLIMFIWKKGEVTTLVTTCGAVPKLPWAVSTGEMSQWK